MSLFIQATTGASGVTADKGSGIYGVNPCPYQIDKQNSFNPSTAIPGQKVDIKLNTVSKDIIRNQDMMIVFDASTTDSTNFCTWKNVSSFCRKLLFNINNGKNKIVYENESDQLRSLMGEWLQEYGEHYYQALEFWGTLGSLGGVQITNAASKTITFPLFIFMSWLQNQVINNTGPKETQEITEMAIEFTFRDAPDNAGEATKWYLSNTTANPYTKSSYSFTNIHLEQHYSIIRDSRFLSRPERESVLIPVPEIEVTTLQNKSWNGTSDTIKFTLSDISEIDDIQYLKIFVRPILAAYNASTAVEHYSGRGIGFKYTEIGGNKDKLDCSSAKDVQKYMIDHITNRYGRQPIEYYTQTNDLGKLYCDSTYIFFDDNKIEPNHTDLLINVSSKKKDYEIILNCLTAVASACDIVIMMYRNQNYKYNADYQLYEAGAIDVSQYAI